MPTILYTSKYSNPISLWGLNLFSNQAINFFIVTFNSLPSNSQIGGAGLILFNWIRKLNINISKANKHNTRIISKCVIIVVFMGWIFINYLKKDSNKLSKKKGTMAASLSVQNLLEKWK